MNKFIGKFLALGTVLIVFSGCSLFGVNPEKDGDKIVKDGLKNFYDVNVASFEGKLNGSIDDKTAEDLSFDVSFSGSGNFVDPKNLLLNLKLDGNGMFGKQNESVSGELKVNKSEMYFLVSKLGSFAGILPEEIVKPLLGQWWKTQVPQDMVDSLQETIAVGDESNLTPEEKKYRELLKSSQFFTGAKYIGEENGDYHYETGLDNEAVKTFAQEYAKINGESFSDEQMKTIDENLKNVQLKAEFWVGVTDKTAHRLKMDINATDPVSGAKMVTLFDVSISDINQPVTVEAPKDAKEFNPAALFGGVAQ